MLSFFNTTHTHNIYDCVPHTPTTLTSSNPFLLLTGCFFCNFPIFFLASINSSWSNPLLLSSALATYRSSYGLVSGHWVGSWFADVFNMVLIVYCLLVLDNLVGSWNYLYRSPPWWQFLEDYKCWVDQRNKINLDCFKSVHQLWQIQKYYVVVGAISIYINLWDKTH